MHQTPRRSDGNKAVSIAVDCLNRAFEEKLTDENKKGGKMAKIVKINFCEECSSCVISWYPIEIGFCYKTPQGQDRRKIDNLDIIPGWCPLEDEKHENKCTCERCTWLMTQRLKNKMDKC